MSQRQDVEFPTVDGLILRGWLYPAKQRGPALIVLPGVGLSHFAPLPENRPFLMKNITV
jgi:hypothetical protein